MQHEVPPLVVDAAARAAGIAKLEETVLSYAA